MTVRESPSLVILPGLMERGAQVRAFDPAGMEEARALLDGVVWCDDSYEAMAGADALVILTEWNEFRALDLERTRSLLRTPAGRRSPQHLRAGRDVSRRPSLREYRPAGGLPVSAGHVLDPAILGAYDIRGIVGETLSGADMAAIGRGFATIARQRATGNRPPRICVGRDGRLSSPDLEAHLVEGLTDAGAEVQRIGVGPTPMLYFAVHERRCDGGLMVTGSHNPPAYNGVKMVLGGGPFHGADIEALAQVVEDGALAAGAGRATEVEDVRDAYVTRLLAEAVGHPFTVAWDAGNGAAGAVLVALVSGLPGRHILLNDAVDGTFPVHHPDPTVPENLAQLIETVRAERCGLGIAFDGDGDRIGVVDGDGAILWGDQLVALLAREVLRENGRARPSSATSRRAGSCSTRSPAWAARR